MGHRMAVVALVVGFALRSPAIPAAADGFDAKAFLSTYADFTKQELSRVSSGIPVSRTLPADSDEIAIAAAVFIGISRSAYLEHFRDIESFKRSPLVLAIGRFSAEPSADDMRGVSLSDDDLYALAHCRPGSCGMRMDKAGIDRLTKSRGTDGNQKGAALREHLAGYAAEYLKRGDAALMEYGDRSRPRKIADELGSIIQRSPYFKHELAAMRGDVSAFPGVGSSPHDHMLYWSVEKIASTPVITLTHAIIAKPASNVT